MKVMADRLVKMLAGIMILSVFFLRGATCCGYKDVGLSITTPRNMEALSGSCLQIPCNFTSTEAFDRTAQLFGVWVKHPPFPNSNAIFNSSGTINNNPMNYPMKIIGNLSQKQCTTVFSDLTSTYTDRYYFRIDGPTYAATAACDTLQITVKDSPPAPSLVILGDLKEKETINITCSAFTPCPHSPPKLTWTLKDDSHNNTERNTDGTFSTQIQESITLTDKHDGYNITCSATYSVNEGKDPKTAEETKTLSVSYAPKSTNASISPSNLVSAGVYVNLTCSSRAKPPVSSFTWFKLSSGKPMNVSEGEVYSFNATEGGVYYCEAKNAIGKETSPQIQLKIKGSSDGPPIGAIVGGVIGIICLVVFVILVFMCWRRSKSAGRSEQCLCQAGEDLAQRKAEDEAGVHYGEIDFSKQRPQQSSGVLQDKAQQEETLYAQVKGPSSTGATESPADLYATVKKN